jgi:hypothetical protein
VRPRGRAALAGLRINDAVVTLNGQPNAEPATEFGEVHFLLSLL